MVDSTVTVRNQAEANALIPPALASGPKSLHEVKTGDIVYVTSPKMSERERDIWKARKVQNISNSGLIMVGFYEYKKDGNRAHAFHPIPGRISLPTPEILANVERFKLWCDAMAMLDWKDDSLTLEKLRKAVAALKRIIGADAIQRRKERVNKQIVDAVMGTLEDVGRERSGRTLDGRTHEGEVDNA